MCLKLFERTLGDAQELNIGFRLLATITLGDIRRNRCCRPTDLGRHTEKLLFREPFGEPIATLRKLHRILPDTKILVGVDYDLTHITPCPTRRCRLPTAY